jgi:hypothetical protein
MQARRHLSMSSISALVAIRRYLIEYPDSTAIAAAESLRRSDVDFAGADFEGAVDLHGLIPYSLCFFSFKNDLQAALKILLLHHRPWWLQAVPYGRERILTLVGRDTESGRNEIQCLRSAGLFEEPPTDASVSWWDDLSQIVRAEQNQNRLLHGRDAERLSLAYELDRLRNLGIQKLPRWMSIEDNSVGYDIQSYSPGPGEVVNRLIEVKSASNESPQIFVTRNEWQTASQFGSSYVFHIWRMPAKTLIERSVDQIRPSIPTDNGAGIWKEVLIDIV